MTNTLNERADFFKRECKVLNLRYEYEGYTGTEHWALVSELSEKELFEKYPDEIRKYIPFVLLSVEQGEVIREYNRNEDKFKKRRQNNESGFGYDELTESEHGGKSCADLSQCQ